MPNTKNPIRKAIRKDALNLAKAVALSGVKATKVKAKSAAKKAVQGIVSVGAAPATTSFKFRAPVPTYIGVKHGIRIKHTEYVQDVQSSSTAKAYSAGKFWLNPANSDTFPWLSDQATSYASYKFHSLSFRIGSLVSTATDGMFGLCATPDITDAIPTNKTNFMQYENAVRNNVWQAATYNVPRDVLARLPEYLTAVTGIGDTDPTKQMGALFICSQGLTGTSVDFGELYVTYDVELIHPQSPNADGLLYQSTPAAGNLWNSANVLKSPSTIFADHRSNTGAAALNSLMVQAAGDFLVVVHVNDCTANPSFSAIDNFGVAITITSLSNVNNGTSGVNFFKVLDAPKPWYLVSSGGTYGGSPLADVYITRNYNHETETFVPTITSLTDRVKQLEKLVCSPDSDEEVYREVTPHPPSTPVPKYARRA